jgi:hypothetical protein
MTRGSAEAIVAVGGGIVGTGALVSVGADCTVKEGVSVIIGAPGEARGVTSGVGELNPGMTQPDKIRARIVPVITSLRMNFLIVSSCDQRPPVHDYFSNDSILLVYQCRNVSFNAILRSLRT